MVLAVAAFRIWPMAPASGGVLPVRDCWAGVADTCRTDTNLGNWPEPDAPALREFIVNVKVNNNLRIKTSPSQRGAGGACFVT